MTMNIVIVPAGSRFAILSEGIAVSFRSTYAAAVIAARELREAGA
jgi:hypothetical protein